jgi:hypothetical protein
MRTEEWLAVSKSLFNHQIRYVNKASGEVDGGTPCPGRFTTGERSPVPIGYEAGWASRAGLNAVENRNLFWGSIPYSVHSTTGGYVRFISTLFRIHNRSSFYIT